MSNVPAPPQLYPLSLHDALPISRRRCLPRRADARDEIARARRRGEAARRSEEHTSELQSRPHLVCRLLLEKKKNAVANAGRTRSAKKIGGEMSGSPASRGLAARR